MGELSVSDILLVMKFLDSSPITFVHEHFLIFEATVVGLNPESCGNSPVAELSL